jgi:hypothetical protein
MLPNTRQAERYFQLCKVGGIHPQRLIARRVSGVQDTFSATKPLEGISAACFSVNNRGEAWEMSGPQIFSIRQRLYTDGEGGGAVDKKTEKPDQYMFYLLTPNILRSKRNCIIASVTRQFTKETNASASPAAGPARFTPINGLFAGKVWLINRAVGSRAKPLVGPPIGYYVSAPINR